MSKPSVVHRPFKFSAAQNKVGEYAHRWDSEERGLSRDGGWESQAFNILSNFGAANFAPIITVVLVHLLGQDGFVLFSRPWLIPWFLLSLLYLVSCFPCFLPFIGCWPCLGLFCALWLSRAFPGFLLWSLTFGILSWVFLCSCFWNSVSRLGPFCFWQGFVHRKGKLMLENMPMVGIREYIFTWRMRKSSFVIFH